MTDQGHTAHPTAPKRSIIDTLELDVRLLGLLSAFAAVAIVFTLWTGGSFVGPRNFFNIAVQSEPVAIMACGMVFVIVARHIDLSIGSMLAMCSAVMAMSRTQWLTAGLGAVASWAVGLIASGIAVWAILAFVGWLSRYPIPAAKLKRLFGAKGEVLPEGYGAMHALPISVMILISSGWQ